MTIVMQRLSALAVVAMGAVAVWKTDCESSIRPMLGLIGCE